MHLVEQFFICKVGWRKPTHSKNRPPTQAISPELVSALFFVILVLVKVVWLSLVD